jgi:hypothetical protein
MSQYLEVRRDDHRGRIILETMESEWEILENAINPNGAISLVFSSDTINSFMNLPVYSPLAIKGMMGIGKIAAAGEYILLCDTLGDRVWMFNRGKPAVIDAFLTRPAALAPISPSEMFVFQENGEVNRLTLDASTNTATLAPQGLIDANVTDAALIDSTFFAVADRKGGVVRLCGLPSLEQTAEWRPDDSDRTDKLFEPVAVSSYGPLLSVADRGNGRVFVLDAYTLSVLDRFDVDSPRDLEWGPNGELYILNEKGTLFSRYPVGTTSPDMKIVADDMIDAWSLTWAGEGPVLTSVSGRTWWSGVSNPGHEEALGAIALHDPWIETVDDGAETLMLRGAASSTFHSFIQNRTPVTQVVWKNEVRPSRISKVGGSKDGAPAFYSTVSGYTAQGERIIKAGSITEVMSDIAGNSRKGENIPRVIVLDSRISGTDEQLSLFLGFLLQQGIRLDLWSLDRPASLLLCHISRITLGHTYYTRAVQTIPFNDSIEWILSVPLPPDLATFGYPSDATLSLFSDIDVIRFTDWIPIWPSLIKRN